MMDFVQDKFEFVDFGYTDPIWIPFYQDPVMSCVVVTRRKDLQKALQRAVSGVTWEGAPLRKPRTLSRTQSIDIG